MQRVPAVVIGAGQAGLAVSCLLSAAGLQHVVLDSGGAGQRWRSHSWESLRLLTPNWLSRLPGWRYAGPDPAGFMTAGAVADHLAAYAVASAAPVVGDARVLSVSPAPDAGYRIVSTAGTWHTTAVVVATGWCQLPFVPPAAAGVPAAVSQLTPATYRSPAMVADGAVLVVGASASGVQLADELAAAGRRVVLAVGTHNRLPRRYRGRDILCWLDAMGVLDRPVTAADRARQHADPSLQLAGRADARDVDLPALQRRGVTLTGRLAGFDGGRVRFAADLRTSTTTADARLRRLLARVDTYAEATGLIDGIPPGGSLATAHTENAPTELDLRAAGIRTVLWATGYRRAYPWLQVPVLDAAGEIRQTAGATPAPGLYVVGMRLQTRRNSTFLDGVGHAAALVAARVLADVGAAASPEAAA